MDDAVANLDDALGPFPHVPVVSDDHHGQTVTVQVIDELQHLFAGSRVEIAGSSDLGVG